MQGSKPCRSKEPGVLGAFPFIYEGILFSKLLNMKNIQKELEQRKATLAIAKQAKKQAREAYRAQLKALKAHLKPFKRALKQAELMEQETKAALKTAAKKTKKADKLQKATPPSTPLPKIKKPKVPTPPAAAEKSTQKRPGRPRNANAAVAPIKKPGRPRLSTAAVTAKKSTGRRPGRPTKSAATPTAPQKSAGRLRKVTTGDNLTRINRLGDKVAAMLIKNGISTFAGLASTPVEHIRELLRKNNMSKYRNPTPWPVEAAKLAAAPPVEAPQAAHTKKVAAKKPGGPRIKKATTKKATGRGPGRPPKATAPDEKKTTGKNSGRPRSTAAATTKKTTGKGSGRPLKAITSTAPTKKAGRPLKAPAGGDDLTRINRLGDKVAAMLIKNGISTFAILAATPVEHIRELLRKNNMSKYRNPGPWPEEAAKLAQK
ncbi:MAG: hypothetical protein EPO28_07165 [Saprospiraceae bacterium]|nr:MAG: hypothetical protein EPO28_07165 [Saprospiraceae bacterium]